MKKLLVSLLCVVMMVTFMPSMAFAEGEDNSEAKTLQQLIDETAEGETLELEEATTYSVDTAVRIDKPITIIGNGATVKNTGSDRPEAILIASSNVTLEDLTLESTYGYGVQAYANPANDPLNGITLRNLQVTSQKGAIFFNHAEGTIEGSNRLNGAWGGIEVDNAGKVTVAEDAVITSNANTPAVWADDVESEVETNLTKVTTEKHGERDHKQVAYVTDENLPGFVDAKTTAGADISEIMLGKDVTLTQPLYIREALSFNGNNHSITGSEAFPKDNIVTVMSDDVAISDLTIKTDVEGKSGLHLYQVNDVTLENLTIIVNNGGAGVLVNGSEATVTGTLDFELGEGAWGGMEVAKGEGVTDTPKVTFNEGSKVAATGVNVPVVYVAAENYLDLDEALVDPENAGLKIDLESGQAVPMTAPEITVSPLEGIVVGKAKDFTISTKANDYDGINVVGKSTLTKDGVSAGEDAVKVEYFEVKDNQWHPLEGSQFGAEGGFPLGDYESQFRATFNEAGSYTMNVEIVEVATNKVLAEKTVDFTVAPKSSGGGIIIPPAAQKPTIEVDEHAKVTLGSDGTTATITVDEGYELADVVLNGVSQGKVTFVYGLKTGDVLKVTTVAKGETEAEKNARLKAGVENTTIKLKSTLGKGHVRLDWNKSEGYKVDNYQVFRSTKRYIGYGTKAYFTTKQGGLKAWYKNTKQLKKGTRYYYKVRGVREIAGETVYTQWSNKAWRLVK